ncbi:MAG: Ig-like domain-containing protein, partial [Myxococcota bacterium]
AAVNGEEPAAFDGTGAVESALPLAGFATIRLVWSEPIDPTTIRLGDTVRLVEVDDSGQEISVAAAAHGQGSLLSIDPQLDMRAGAVYRLLLSDGIRDAGGEPVSPAQLVFEPDGAVDSPRYAQVLNAEPADGDERFPADGALAAGAANLITVSSPLIGAAELAVKDGSIRAELADPTGFGGPIPLTIRKGQLLRSTGLEVAFAGAVPSGLSTGDIAIRFISDATGYLIRSPYRAPEQIPDDDGAPVFAILTLDLALSASDPRGNAVLTQTVLGVQVAGVATVDGDQLSIETVGAIELDLLGLARAPAQLSLRLATQPGGAVASDGEPPRIVATYPAMGDDRASVDDSILITLSEPVELEHGDGAAAVRLITDSGVPVPSTVATNGSALVVVADQPLDDNSGYAVVLGDGLRDLAGNPLQVSPDDPTQGLGALIFRTSAISGTAPTAPVLLSVYPGLSCALSGGDANSPGRCVGAGPDDPLYAALDMSGTDPIDVRFNQPMAPDRLTLGTRCGQGSVRIERLDPGGQCAAAVPGRLVVRERSFRFVPDQRWADGQPYRLTLVAGADPVCDPGEICGVNGRPLNSDPLCGIADGSDDTNRCGDGSPDEGGGPDIAIPFVGGPATTDIYVPVVASPRADRDGDGQVDSDMLSVSENRAVLEIRAVDGDLVRDAWFARGACLPGDSENKDDALHLTASLAVIMGSPRTDCTVGMDGQGTPIVAERCVPVEILPGVLLGTSVGLCVQVPGLTATTATEQLVMRVGPERGGGAGPGAPITGYIYSDPQGQQALFSATLPILLDAPDFGFGVLPLDHDLRSTELLIEVTGVAGFSADGQLLIELESSRDIAFDAQIVISTAPEDPGFMTMAIPAGGMRLQLRGLPSKDIFVRP